MSSYIERKDFPLPNDKSYLKSSFNYDESIEFMKKHILHYKIREDYPQIPRLYERLDYSLILKYQLK